MKHLTHWRVDSRKMPRGIGIRETVQIGKPMIRNAFGLLMQPSMAPDNDQTLTPPEATPSRRNFVTGAVGMTGLALAGCSASSNRPLLQSSAEPTAAEAYAFAYNARPEEKFPLPAVDLSKVPPEFYRRQVNYSTNEPVGTLIVDTGKFYLYLVQPGGKAIRYGVGLGRAGFAWSGRARVAWKQVWPKWTPPAEMIARRPELAKYSAENGSMAPSLANPLGARALYIFQGNVDTLYRLHGTNEFESIGRAVSSGCVRLLNQDVIDLYNRVPKQTPIVVV